MNHTQKEVYTVSRSHCRVGKITPKRNNDEPIVQSESESKSNQ